VLRANGLRGRVAGADRRRHSRPAATWSRPPSSAPRALASAPRR
jgi:hypothetical protein